MSPLKILTASAAVALAAALPASADPSVGIGATFLFGGNSAASGEFGIGARVFSTDKEDHGAVSIGVDYVPASNRWRPTVGGAYLFDNTFLGLDIGYGLFGGGVDFGVSGGFANTKNKTTASSPPSNIGSSLP